VLQPRLSATPTLLACCGPALRLGKLLLWYKAARRHGVRGCDLM
jgi:hypothetical protein